MIIVELQTLDGGRDGFVHRTYMANSVEVHTRGPNVLRVAMELPDETRTMYDIGEDCLFKRLKLKTIYGKLLEEYRPCPE